MTKKVMPEGCCACHNISIYSCSAVIAQPSGHCRLFHNNSDHTKNLKPHHQEETRNEKNNNNWDQMISCSGNKGITPLFQIHKNSIHISNTTQLRVHMIGPREVEITCLECGCLLHVYASKKGAFCQITESKPVIMCGSYPSETLLGCLCFSSLPSSMRSLFKKEEENFFYNLENYTSEDPYDHSSTLSSGVDIEPRHSFTNQLDFSNFSEGDENEDYDLMFSSQIEPVVGSYAELGLFLTNTNQLVM